MANAFGVSHCRHLSRLGAVTIGPLVLAGAALVVVPALQARRDVQPLPSGVPAPVDVGAAPLARPGPCTGGFVAHALDRSTEVSGERVHLFDGNGSGLAIDDLDGDGRLDIVLGNLNGPSTILWNEGDLAFRREGLAAPGVRGVNVVDVDGDGRLDIAFTHRGGGVSLWRNSGTASSPRSFVAATLSGVRAPAYAMAWADLGGDGALDLVTASHDGDLDRALRGAFLFSDGAGVWYYERQGAGFVARRLARESQALAIALPDLDADGRRDLLVGSDFTVRDQAWLRTGDDWAPTDPFTVTAENTMSYDEGDVDNDGRPELFATDMKPYEIDTSMLAAWLPLMARMPERHDPADPQRVANVLQVRAGDGRFRDEAAVRGLDATGWSWSGKFGDLDNDGFLDLYVVNGMVAAELFPYLPDDELVEQNQARRNQGDGTFTPAPEWGLGATSSGRGMTMADLNGDGGLELVVNNVRAPALLFENRICGGAALEVDLRWPTSANTRAIGARMALGSDAGTFFRDVRSGSGYLSGDTSRVHFGIPAGATLARLEIVWPDGAASTVGEPRPGSLLTVTRR